MTIPKLLYWFSLIVLSISATPLCEKCKCSSEDSANNTKITSVDVNCEKVFLVDFLFSNTTWIDEKNVSLPVIGLNMRSNNLANVNTAFPKCDIAALDLSNNSIIELGSQIFANLDKLKYLQLSNNKLENISPESFKGYYHALYHYPLLALRDLVLNDNRLHTLDKDLFEYTPNLMFLSIAGNPLKMLDVHTIMAITSIVHLKSLDLSRTQLSSIPDNFLHTPKYLLSLNISFNNFDSVPKELANSTSLEILHFNGNPITNFTHKTAFPHIKFLKKLHFCDMPMLKEIEAHTFGNLNNLVELHICRNPTLTFIHSAAFNRKGHGVLIYPELHKLYLQKNNLTHLDKHLLKNWMSLHDFDLSDNPWKCDCSNYWMIYNLTYVSEKLDRTKWHGVPRIHHNKKFTCASPDHLKGKTFYDISNNNTYLDCKAKAASIHSVVLVGIITSILVATLVIGLLAYLYKKDHINYKKLTNLYTFRFNNTEEDLTTTA